MNFPPKNQVVPLEVIKALCLEYGKESLWDLIQKDPPLKPFTSDGVTAFPDKIHDVDLYPAAFFHDLKYWSGYPGDHNARFVADCELAIDVIQLCGGNHGLAELMLLGVRGAGALFWGRGRAGED